MLTGRENYIYCYQLQGVNDITEKKVNVNAGIYLQGNTVLLAMRLRFVIEWTEQVGYILSPDNGSRVRF
jgi:hypothetical protein